ncbi:MAG: beta-ketoacyl-[acyl-carrier-protein] synthase II, partial [Chloroflexi bacterium]|nr:beta-ketoacyl-[acyl-carrier-protein] synthase II [Chloroflexota bacterium]
EVVIAGGADACVLPLAIAGFSVMRALAREKESPERSCRPFASDRDGFVLAEGAAALVLESLEHAQKRGATIYGELVGYGSSADAYHMISPDEAGDGAVRAMECALKKADLTSEQVDYINAHGTGTPVNDRAETLAIKRVFGSHVSRLVVSSTKSMTGHMMGASGAVEAIVCLLTIRNSIVPPTINLDHPDPECDLDYVPHQARKARVEVALSNAMGLGGHNSCVIFRRFPS